MDGAKTIKYSFESKKINRVFKFLTLSDFLILGGFGLILPIFAIFITEQIPGAGIEVVGLAEAVYLAVRSISQIPFGHLIDKIKGEKDDFWFLLLGSMLISFVPIMYIFVDSPAKLYAVQFFYGLVGGATFPTWYAIFTRHIDKEKAGIEWGLYQTMADMSTALFSALGGFLVSKFNFKLIFILVSCMSFIGSLSIMGIYSKMTPGKVLYRQE